jgi:medium-chain acyl-[acyl-carrier-protein] hydrolase
MTAGAAAVLGERLARLTVDERARLVARLRGRPGTADGWFARYTTTESAALRLFCFSYAGGGGSVFRSWGDRLPREIDVWAAQLPGREARVVEAPVRRIGPLVDALHEAIMGCLDKPYAFFGHSMGALAAFELSRRLRLAGAPEPAHLFLAAFRAPQLPNPNIKICHLPDEVLKTVLRKEGTPENVLDDEELMRALLPTLRADLELCETYEYRDEPPLAVPMTVFGGSHDVRVSRDDLEQWRAQATGQVRISVLPGSHFFVHSAQDLLLSEICRDLGAAGFISEGPMP